MTGTLKGNSQAIAAHVAEIEHERAKRENAGPAGGLLIAVGTSLILWAVIAEGAKFASALFF